ncbi:MAG: ferrochelatase [Verrucomicrobiota bacterium]|jgi:ferrochelatase
MKNRAVLLVNLGSPDSPSVPDVRAYLREFLMDGRVLDAPWPVRWAIVHLSILPRRPAQSAEAYEKIWTPAGSPLVVASQKVREQLQDRVGIKVELAMRYRRPSIENAVRALRDAGVGELLLIPLFPHYAMSSFQTAVERVKEVLAGLAPTIALTVVPPYYDHPAYIRALVASASDYLKQDHDHLLFSFHGIPERHLRKADPTGGHCLIAKDCCDKSSPAFATCYRAQCFATARQFVKAAAIPEHRYSIAFQSRLGRDPWLKPYTDYLLEDIAKSGVKKLLVLCPSFVSDCLETLEEIGIRGRETFRHAGGQELTLIPCLNQHPLWLTALQTMVTDWQASPTPPLGPLATAAAAK